MPSARLVEISRGEVLESTHRGHVAVCDASGALVDVWGDPTVTVLPRSASKMIQALPLVESGAADAAGLGPEHLALACASHTGSAMHTARVEAWLTAQGLGEADLRCGPEMPSDPAAAKQLICSDRAPCQVHNNCSGKHAGFLTLTRHLGAGPEYVDPDHPVQRAVRAAWQDVTAESIAATAIDGCSAPNLATSLHGIARAMAAYAAARSTGGTRATAQSRLVAAMIAHPELVAGEDRAATVLMRACQGRAAVKSGAEGVYVAILPGARLGIALKIEDGAARAAEAAMAALLVRNGALDAAHPVAAAYIDAPVLNRRDIVTGRMRCVI